MSAAPLILSQLGLAPSKKCQAYLGALTIAGCDGVQIIGGSGDDGPTTGGIKGNVSDATTGNPLEGAAISTDPETNDTQTDSDGGYTIADVDPGSHTVKASKDGYSQGTKSVTVKAGEDAVADIDLDPTVTSVAISPTSATLNVGATISLIATVSYGNNTTDSDVNWSSTNLAVATVSSDGVVTGVGGGSASVSATANKDTSQSATAEVMVEGPTASPTSTPTVSPSPTAAVSPSPTATASPSPTAAVSPSPTATSSPTPTATASPTATPTPQGKWDSAFWDQKNWSN